MKVPGNVIQWNRVGLREFLQGLDCYYGYCPMYLLHVEDVKQHTSALLFLRISTYYSKAPHYGSYLYEILYFFHIYIMSPLKPRFWFNKLALFISLLVHTALARGHKKTCRVL